MASSRWQLGSPFVIAMLGSALVGGQYVADSAARDALFLANFETSSLPAMIIVIASFSIVLVVQESDDRSFLEGLVRDRASQSLAHVFTLLALVLPAQPLRIPFRALHTDDQGLRGTALEYLDSVLPHEIRDRLWPFLEGQHISARIPRPREETLAERLRSNDSIEVNLEQLKKRAAGVTP